MRTTFPIALLCVLAVVPARAQSPYQSSSDFAKYAMKLREDALLRIEPQVFVPTTRAGSSVRYPWKTNIVTTIFWIGEHPTVNNPVPNNKSSWDADWERNYGGFDNPDPSARRSSYIPAGFIPRLNPFYCALPYNDVTSGTTKPEARLVIPWFRQTFVKEGQSVCRDRWLAIRNPANNRVAYAQWSDCGPFRTDHWEYVFGNDRPKWNLNHGAGLDVSPAVRDYLGIGAVYDVTDWKFVEFSEVLPGPWTQFGENNDFVQIARRNTERVANKTPATGPRVIIK